jgi:type II secretory pathway pseudopilin PulG
MFMKIVKKQYSKSAQNAFSLIEMCFALVILLMIIVMFTASFPFVIRNSQFSNNYAQASFLAQHKIDQLRAAGWDKIVDSTKLTGSGNSTTDVTSVTPLTNLGIIDSGQNSAPWSFVNSDSLAAIYGSGCTGTIKITPDQNDTYCSNAKSTCDVVTVTVTITWPNSGRSSSGSYSIFAKIISMQHQ